MSASKKPIRLGCDYEAPHFGAFYPDACCIDGFLWDLDSCEEPGGPLTHGGDMPCPSCNTASYVRYRFTNAGGNARQRRRARRDAARSISLSIEYGGGAA